MPDCDSPSFFDGRPIAPWPENPSDWVNSVQVARRLGYPSLRAFWEDKTWRLQKAFPEPLMKRRWRASQIDNWLAWRERFPDQPLPANDHIPTAKRNQRQSRPHMSAAEKIALARARHA